MKDNARAIVAAAILVSGCGGDGRSGPDIVAQFTHYWVESDPNRSFSATFLGVPTWQNPLDLWSMQEILSEVRPDFVVETGTAHGGSALYFAAMLAQLGKGRVITIDIEPQVEEAQQHQLFAERVDLIVGDSVAPETLAEVRRWVAGGTVLVTLDSMHTTAHVRRELELYAELVSPGSYLVVQDTVIDEHPEWIERYAAYDGSTSGPAPAVAEFLERRDDFVADRSRERFLFTFHPGGYLRRVREQ